MVDMFNIEDIVYGNSMIYGNSDILLMREYGISRNNGNYLQYEIPDNILQSILNYSTAPVKSKEPFRDETGQFLLDL